MASLRLAAVLGAAATAAALEVAAGEAGNLAVAGSGMCTSKLPLVHSPVSRSATVTRTARTAEAGGSSWIMHTSFPGGTATASTAQWFNGSWSATSSTSDSLLGATTTTSTLFMGQSGGYATTTSTSACGGVVTTTTTSSGLSLNPHGGDVTSTSSTTSGGEVTTTTTSGSWSIFNATDAFWTGSLSLSSSSASGGVVTTGTHTLSVFLGKVDDAWRGSATITGATASGGGAGTSTQCMQLILPGFFNPLEDLSRVFVASAAGWQHFVKWSSPAGILGLLAGDPCDAKGEAPAAAGADIRV